MNQVSNKEAMRRLQEEALTRAIKRKWVKDTAGLLPHVAAALEHQQVEGDDHQILIRVYLSDLKMEHPYLGVA